MQYTVIANKKWKYGFYNAPEFQFYLFLSKRMET